MSIHPIDTTEYLRATYERYLKTIYPFQDAQLSRRFWDQLGAADRLVKGPLLEASPSFRPGRSIEQMVADGHLNSRFLELCASTAHLERPPLPANRPLYLHQERAILNVVRDSGNLVVATGTGSGKTESFLIPIVNHLLNEKDQGTLAQPGVRALLLYPMNALANDQLSRLRILLQGYPSITFGRYTGETLHDEDKARAKFLSTSNPGPLLPNELHSRDEMREFPPHILLTNYAMLEYLLLRPQDTELFDGPSGRCWRFIVVDEAHVYDGAAGIEVAMLLRRLKDRVVGSVPGRLTCIATSATLGRGEEDFPEVAQFAANLFGESFDTTDVVGAERQSVSDLGPMWGRGSPALYSELAGREQDSPREIADIASCHGVPSKVLHDVRNADNGSEGLYILLSGDQTLRSLQTRLSEQPCLLTSVAKTLFPTLPEQTATEAAIQLVSLAVSARPAGDSSPLLPARYHVFARATEGAFVCLNSSAHLDDEPRLFLNRHEKCPEAGCGAQVFEVATCARCGAVYIVGEQVTNTRADGGTETVIHPLKGDLAVGRGAKRVYYVLSEDLPEFNEDELVDSEYEQSDDNWQLYTICLRCGSVHQVGEGVCGCGGPRRTVRLAPFDGSAQDRMYCPVCSTRSRGVVYRLLTGQDAPVSVLATALYTQLPPAQDENTLDLPGQGRKLLMFADSRQDAAFFAPYLERTFDNLLQRRLIFTALMSDEAARSGQLRLNSLAKRLLRQSEEAGILSLRQDYDEKVSQMKMWLIREMMSWGFQQSLERLGLLYFRLVCPEQWKAPRPLLEPPWNLSESETWDLICLLIDTVRRAGALVFPDGIDPREAFFQPLNRQYYLSDHSLTDKRMKKRYAVYGWLPRRGSNSRLDLLERLLAHIAPQLDSLERRQYSADALGKLWHAHLANPSSVWREYLPKTDLGSAGPAHRLDPAFWEWVLVGEKTPIWRCSRCRNISYRSVNGVCTTYGCDGKLEPLSGASLDDVNNHYRHLYRNLTPAAISVQEHTAQWRSETAREIQEDFVNGRVNALSCSTTFELGVDVGSLQTVLMRNVPPTTANYLQRAGRAGRRQDTAAYVLTFAQRRSHDLAYYRNPEKLVAGAVPTPTVEIRNPKIVRRHMHSVLIAAFLRWCADTHHRFGERRELRVGPFFAPRDGRPSGPELLTEYLEMPPSDIREALLRIVPEDLHGELNIENWQWLSELTSTEGSGAVDLASARVNEDLDLYTSLAEKESAKATAAGSMKAASYYRIHNTISERDLINFLGQLSILPKYGFPVDVVELRTDHIPDKVASEVQLQRDLRIAISEYAPGGMIVAGKRVFTGGGLYKQPQKDWVTVPFAVCGECGRFNTGRVEEAPTHCVTCGNALPMSAPWRGGVMVIPEFGFVARREERLPSPGESRPPRVYSSHVYFDGYDFPEELPEILEGDHYAEPLPIDELTGSQLQVFARYSRYGQLAVVNHGPAGRGYNICLLCGHAEPAPELPSPGSRHRRTKRAESNHRNPRTGRECSGYTRVLKLGHRFVTDVLELHMEGPLTSGIRVPEGKNLWRSLLYALLEGASQALGIRRNDLNGTLYPYSPTYIPALMLYDDVPGGAGHVRRIKDSLPAVFEAALDRIDKCECGPETACHECLWNFYNQPYHDEIARGLAVEFLNNAVKQ